MRNGARKHYKLPNVFVLKPYLIANLIPRERRSSDFIRFVESREEQGPFVLGEGDYFLLDGLIAHERIGWGGELLEWIGIRAVWMKNLSYRTTQSPNQN